MLKQIETEKNIYNNWKNLGDKSAVFQGCVVAILNIEGKLQHCYVIPNALPFA